MVALSVAGIITTIVIGARTVVKGERRQRVNLQRLLQK